MHYCREFFCPVAMECILYIDYKLKTFFFEKMQYLTSEAYQEDSGHFGWEPRQKTHGLHRDVSNYKAYIYIYRTETLCKLIEVHS